MENLNINDDSKNQMDIDKKMRNLFDEIIDNIFTNKQLFLETEAKSYFMHNTKNLIDDDNVSCDKKHFSRLNIGNGYDVIAVKNCPQLKGFLCGYHTLFNTINFLKFYYAYEKALFESTRDSDSKQIDSNIESALYYLNKMNNRSKFWKFHLKAKIFFANAFPSEEKNLHNLSSLERYQLRHYINNNKNFLKLLNDSNVDIQINYFYISFGIINSLTKPEIVDLQNRLRDFKNRNNKKTQLFIIVLGIVNHWSVMIIEKKNEKYRVFYLDSYEENLPILGNMDHMEELADKLLKETEKYKKPVSEWGRKCFYQFLRDLHLSFQIIFDVIYKDFSLVKFFLENILINFTNSFFNFIDEDSEIKITSNEDADKDKENYFNAYFEIFSKILNWVKMDYHPRVIHLDIVSTMQIFDLSRDSNLIEPSLISKMKRILGFLSNLENKFSQFNVLFSDIFSSEDIELIERLISVNEQMKEYF